MPIKFRFSWAPFLAMLFVVCAGCALGRWQLHRAAEKEAIEQLIRQRAAAAPLVLGAADAPGDALEYRQVRVTGQFVRDWPLYLENRPYHDAPGFYVLMPFRPAGSDRNVLVVRGWLARDLRDRTRLPPLATPAGSVTIEGIVRSHIDRVLQLGQAPLPKPGAIVQNADPSELQKASGLPMQPFVIEQTSAAADGLVRDWPRPSAGIERHLGYAVQWFGLAATAFVFFIVTGIRRARSTEIQR